MNRFKIIIPVWNAENYIEKCLNSVMSQKYKNFDVIVIDDASTDSTYFKASAFPFHLMRNKEKSTSLENIIKGINQISNVPSDVICLLDGDDWLSDNLVLNYLNEAYSEDVWLTYGSFLPVNSAYPKYGELVTNIKTYRKSNDWTTSHLKTFRRKLFDKIKDEDLRDWDGMYFKTSGDRALMYPMIEMAGKHSKFIDRVIYIYNNANPICDMYAHEEESLRTMEFIQNKPIYQEL